MKTNEEKLRIRIDDICERIWITNNRIDSTIDVHEIAKLEKVRKKLFKEKTKLINKLYPPEPEPPEEECTP